jgi:hypothetical protein
MEGKALGINDDGNDNIPFGARAIESGIQVDGIWISDQNTPSSSPVQPGTPAKSRQASSTTNTRSQETLKPPPIKVTACDGSTSPVDSPQSRNGAQGLQLHSMARGPQGRTSETNRLSPDGEHLKRNETLELERSGRDYVAYQTYLQPSRCSSPVDRPTSGFTTPSEERCFSGISMDSLPGVYIAGYPPSATGNRPYLTDFQKWIKVSKNSGISTTRTRRRD